MFEAIWVARDWLLHRAICPFDEATVKLEYVFEPSLYISLADSADAYGEMTSFLMNNMLRCAMYAPSKEGIPSIASSNAGITVEEVGESNICLHSGNRGENQDGSEKPTTSMAYAASRWNTDCHGWMYDRAPHTLVIGVISDLQRLQPRRRCREPEQNARW